MMFCRSLINDAYNILAKKQGALIAPYFSPDDIISLED
jgi:hypothetical protein